MELLSEICANLNVTRSHSNTLEDVKNLINLMVEIVLSVLKRPTQSVVLMVSTTRTSAYVLAKVTVRNTVKENVR